MPQYSYTPTATSTAAPATVPNYYSSTPNNSPASPAFTASARNSATANSSLTPQQGLYGSTGYTDAITGRQQTPFGSTRPAPTSPSAPANSYPATAANNSYSNGSYSNPVRPPIPPSTIPPLQAAIVTVPPAAIRYGSSGDRYGSIPDRSTSADRYSQPASSAESWRRHRSICPDRQCYSRQHLDPARIRDKLRRSGSVFSDQQCYDRQRFGPALHPRRATATQFRALRLPQVTIARTPLPRRPHPRAIIATAIHVPRIARHIRLLLTLPTLRPSMATVLQPTATPLPAIRPLPAAILLQAHRLTVPIHQAAAHTAAVPVSRPAIPAPRPQARPAPTLRPARSTPAGSSNDATAYRPGSVSSYTPRNSGTTASGIATTPDTASPYMPPRPATSDKGWKV